MEWITASIIFFGALICFSIKGKRHIQANRSDKREPAAKLSRDDRVPSAINSGNLENMEQLLREVKSPKDRHYLLSKMVKKVYAVRREPPMRARLYDLGKIYLSEFDRMAPLIKETSGDGEMDVPVFKCLAIAMEEDKRFNEAISICKNALAWELDDGTKTGYKGRIERIIKKQSAT